MKVGIVIPVLNGARDLAFLLPTLLAEPGVDSLLVVDSSSSDQSSEIVRSHDSVQLLTIPRSEFNHGATREQARLLLGVDVVVFLTQDVLPEPGFLAPLLAPILSGKAAVTYARQLPREGSDFFEAFPRDFNYPAESNHRSLAQASNFGVYTFLCSNSCAAYSNAVLNEIGGFRPILSNEDYIAAARILEAGHQIYYVASSRVRHSHRYTLKAEFQRFFDHGYVRAQNAWIAKRTGFAEGRGFGYARTMLRQLTFSTPQRLPYGIAHLAAKWAGFRLGYFACRAFPRNWCRVFSDQKYYWNSQYWSR